MFSQSPNLHHYTLEFPRPPRKPRILLSTALVEAPPARPPTSKQTRVLRFVHGFRSAHNVGPTLQEIADAVGVAKSDASRYVHILLSGGSLQGQYSVFGERKRLREGSLAVADAVAAAFNKETANE